MNFCRLVRVSNQASWSRFWARGLRVSRKLGRRLLMGWRM